MSDWKSSGAGLDRRRFLGASAAVALGSALPGATRAEEGDSAAPFPAPPSPASFELEEVGLADLAAGLAAGRWTSQRLVELYRERIAAVDRDERGTNATAELDPDAEAIAAERDRERRDGKLRGPLHGIPVMVKDNIDSAGRMKTTAGSLALATSIAARDAFVLERLRAAGVVLLGKTNLSEWANFRSSHATSGWSGRGGQVRNPYALDRNPCGSSSGSGVAAAASCCAATVGTETDGSVTCPASMNGIVGLKPTVGLVSRSGIVPISHSQDTAGPMGRTVADVAILLAGMTGVDPRDPATAAGVGRAVADYRAGFSRDALRGARLGVVRAFFAWHPEIERQMAGVLEALRSLGAVLVDPVEIPHRSDLGNPEDVVLHYEFKHDLNAYLEALPPGQPRSLAELIAFNRVHAAEEMPWFGQEIFEESEAKGPLTDKAYLDALADSRRLSRTEGLDVAFAKHRLDALVGPTAGPAFLTDWVNGDAFGGSATSPCAVSGYPHLTQPGGYVEGLPWGLSWLGRPWNEAKLLAYGDAFERVWNVRRAPRFLATAELTPLPPAAPARTAP